MMLALAFVPPADVQRVYAELHDVAPEELLPIRNYFSETYIYERAARGRRREVPPRYAIGMKDRAAVGKPIWLL